MNRLFVLLLAGSLAACGAAPRVKPKDTLTGSVNHDGKFLVVALDVSRSMKKTDPRYYNELGSHLAIALAGGEDNFGAVAFSTRGRILAKLRQVRNRDGRDQLHRSIGEAPRDGMTNFVDALKWTADVLRAGEAPGGSVAILLTDGEHTTGGNEEDVLQELVEFRKKQWRIFTIGLGAEAETELLRRIAVTTHGAHFGVARAEDLVKAFLAILGQVHHLLYFDGPPRPVRMLPGTKRLLFMAIKESPEGTILSAIHDGTPFDPASNDWIKWPVKVDPHKDLEVATVEQPASGIWSLSLQGKIRIGAILQQPPFTIRLDKDTLQAEYYENETIHLPLLIEGGGSGVLDHVRQNAKADASVVSADSGETMASLDLPLDRTRKDLVRFYASAPPKLSTPGKAELQTIIARFTLQEKGGGKWRHESRVSVLVRPGKRPMRLLVSPKSIDLGEHWSNEEEVRAALALSTTGRRLQTEIRADAREIQLASTLLEVTSKETLVGIRIDPSRLAAGVFESRIDLRGREGDLDEPDRVSVPIRIRIVRLKGLPKGGNLSLGTKAQGDPISHPFPVSVEGREVTQTVKALQGPVAIPLELREGELVGRIPADAPEGDYRGEVVIGAEGLPDRIISVTLRVESAVARFTVTPKEIVFEADKPGSYKQVLEITIAFPRKAPIRLTRENLRSGENTIRSAYIGFLPKKDEWSGKELEPGRKVHATVRVKVKSDHPNGDYRGKITLSVPGKEGSLGSVDIPIRIQVKQ
jgi:hypothetical protein